MILEVKETKNIDQEEDDDDDDDEDEDEQDEEIIGHWYFLKLISSSQLSALK